MLVRRETSDLDFIFYCQIRTDNEWNCRVELLEYVISPHPVSVVEGGWFWIHIQETMIVHSTAHIHRTLYASSRR